MRKTHTQGPGVPLEGRRPGERSQRGAAIVEFAIVFPLMFLLLAGIVDFGMAFVSLNSTRHGVREGARQAAVANFGDVDSCGVSASVPAATRSLMCLTKDRIGLDHADTRIKVVMPDDNQVGASVIVCAQHPLRSTTGIFDLVLNGRVLTSKVEMRIEKVDSGLEPAEEAPLTGGSWSWCA